MIDVSPPPAIVQLAQAQAPAAQAPAAPPPAAQPPAAQPPAAEAPRVEVKPLDVGRYLPDGALSATVIVTVTPPTGTVAIYTPGFEDSPVVFHGRRMTGEIRLNGPTVYVHLEDGATDFQIQYLNWRQP